MEIVWSDAERLAQTNKRKAMQSHQLPFLLLKRSRPLSESWDAEMMVLHGTPSIPKITWTILGPLDQRPTAKGRWMSSDKSCNWRGSSEGLRCRQDGLPPAMACHGFPMACGQASERAQMARLKQQQQMETVEAQVGREMTRGCRVFSLWRPGGCLEEAK